MMGPVSFPNGFSWSPLNPKLDLKSQTRDEQMYFVTCPVAIITGSVMISRDIGQRNS
ncbi:hypothetical protein Hanom_Chr16g01474531 [Helianthus anomalus]